MSTLLPRSSTLLVVQILEGIRRRIDAGSLRAGFKVAAVRQFAVAHELSVLTVVEAHDRLVAHGWLVSRPNQGFFV